METFKSTTPPFQQSTYSNRVEGEVTFKEWLGEGIRQLALFPALSLVTPVKARGLENLTGQGPYIFAANHSSHLDTLVVLAALPLRWRLRLKVAAAADYFFNKGWKSALVSTVINAFPFVRKGEGCAASLLTAQQMLQAGQSLLIFPEGTRSPTGQLQPFKRGIGRLVLATNAAVIPVWIDGAYAAMPKGAKWPRSQPITVTFGKPLSFAPNCDPAQVAAEVEARILVGAGSVLR